MSAQNTLKLSIGLAAAMLSAPQSFAGESIRDNPAMEVQIRVFDLCYAELTPDAQADRCKFIRPCIDAHRDNSTTSGMSRCAQLGRDVWEGKLSAEYNRLTQFLSESRSPDTLARAREAHARWQDYREAECLARLAMSELRLGAISQSCRAEFAADRALQYRRQLLNWQGRGEAVPQYP